MTENCPSTRQNFEEDSSSLILDSLDNPDIDLKESEISFYLNEKNYEKTLFRCHLLSLFYEVPAGDFVIFSEGIYSQFLDPRCPVHFSNKRRCLKVSTCLSLLYWVIFGVYI